MVIRFRIVQNWQSEQIPPTQTHFLIQTMTGLPTSLMLTVMRTVFLTNLKPVRCLTLTETAMVFLPILITMIFCRQWVTTITGYKRCLILIMTVLHPFRMQWSILQMVMLMAYQMTLKQLTTLIRRTIRSFSIQMVTAYLIFWMKMMTTMEFLMSLKVTVM